MKNILNPRNFFTTYHKKMAANTVSGIALITGGASGIGRETGYSFAEAGALGIIFADKNLAGAQDAVEHSKKLAKNSKFRAIAVEVDVTKVESVKAMIDRAVQEFGRIDYSVHSAGVGIDSNNPIFDVSAEEFDSLADINTKGTLLCMREVSKIMKDQEPLTVTTRNGERKVGRGSIINLGSAHSYVALPGKIPYVTSKFAVLGMTKTAALDCSAYDVRVNAVCPSWVATPMMQRDFDRTPELQAFIKAAVPVGRMAAPEEVGDVIVFLCSPSASYINGTGLLIDAGVTLSLHLG